MEFGMTDRHWPRAESRCRVRLATKRL